MKFYDCSTAPSPRRIRIYLAEKGLQLPVVEVDLRHGEQHGKAFQAINPYRTVPVLELDDGSYLNTTAGIWHYLEQQYPDPPLMGHSAAMRGHVIDLETRIELEGFQAVGEAFRNRTRAYANNALPGPREYAQIPALVERGQLRVTHFFEWLDSHLSDRQFVAGEHYSIADITAWVTVEFSAWIKMGIPDDAPNLARWHQQISQRPSASL